MGQLIYLIDIILVSLNIGQPDRKMTSPNTNTNQIQTNSNTNINSNANKNANTYFFVLCFDRPKYCKDNREKDETMEEAKEADHEEDLE